MAISGRRRERMNRALDLRRGGASYRAIAATLGVSLRQAELDVKDALREITREPAQDVLILELGRLDDLYMIAYTEARKNRDMRAINAAVRVSERRSKLLGLDIPDTSASVETVSSLLEQLIGE